MQILKQLADELRIAFLLVHHLRKQGDSDPLNKLSGTTGLSGAVDAMFVLDRSRRHSDSATLVCTGRDIAYRELELRFSGEEHRWELVTDSLQMPDLLLPPEMVALVEWTKEIGSFSGTNSELAQRFNTYTGTDISAKMLKQMMNRWRYLLEDRGVIFHSYRSNGQRLVKISFSAVPSDASDVEDVGTGCAKTCGPCVPCAPAVDAQPAEEGTVMAGDADSSITGSPAKPSGAVSPGRGGSTERGSFQPRSEATDAQSLPTRGQAEPSSDFVGLGAAGNRRIPGGSPDPL